MRPGAFKPSVNGFPFSAPFVYPGSLLGLAAPLSPEFGLGGGMCWAALDRFLAGRRISRSLQKPQAGEPLYMELVQRQANTLASGGWSKVMDWQRRPDLGGSLRTADLAELTRREWPYLKRSLDAGVPVLLFLVRVAGPFANPSENRQVLAYRYQIDDRSKRLSIWVYDPNRPDNNSVRLTLALNRRRGSLDMTLAASERIRGFFVVPYDREAPPVMRANVAVGGRTAATPKLADSPVGAARRGRIDVVGRGEAGDVIHFSRRRTGEWKAHNLTARRGRSAAMRVQSELAIESEVRPRIYARAADGSLVEYRKRRSFGWSTRNLTGRRGVGPSFRIDEDPCVLRGKRSRLSVFAAGRRHLMHYEERWGRWRAEDLTRRLGLGAAFDLDGHVVACTGDDRTQHVFGRNLSGELIHFHRSAEDGRWRAENASRAAGGWQEYLFASDPVPVPMPDGVHVFGLTADDQLMLYRRNPRGKWSARGLTADLAEGGEGHRISSGLSAVSGPGGTVHVFGVGPEAGLIHYWAVGGVWRAQDLTLGRATIGEEFCVDGRPSVVYGPGEALHVLARGGSDLLLYRWSRDADWIAENLSQDRWAGAAGRVGADPHLVVGAEDELHVLTLDEAGRLQHAGPPAESAPKRWAAALRRAFGSIEYVLYPVLSAPGALLASIGRMGRRGRTATTRTAGMFPLSTPRPANSGDAPQPGAVEPPAREKPAASYAPPASYASPAPPPVATEPPAPLTVEGPPAAEVAPDWPEPFPEFDEASLRFSPAAADESSTDADRVEGVDLESLEVEGLALDGAEAPQPEAADEPSDVRWDDVWSTPAGEAPGAGSEPAQPTVSLFQTPVDDDEADEEPEEELLDLPEELPANLGLESVEVTRIGLSFPGAHSVGPLDDVDDDSVEDTDVAATADVADPEAAEEEQEIEVADDVTVRVEEVEDEEPAPVAGIRWTSDRGPGSPRRSQRRAADRDEEPAIVEADEVAAEVPAEEPVEPEPMEWEPDFDSDEVEATTAEVAEEAAEPAPEVPVAAAARSRDEDAELDALFDSIQDILSGNGAEPLEELKELLLTDVVREGPAGRRAAGHAKAGAARARPVKTKAGTKSTSGPDAEETVLPWPPDRRRAGGQASGRQKSQPTAGALDGLPLLEEGEAAERPAARRRASPAIDGLPMLEEESTGENRPGTAQPGAGEKARGKRSGPAAERDRRRRQLLEMQKILQLSEEFSPTFFGGQGTVIDTDRD